MCQTVCWQDPCVCTGKDETPAFLRHSCYLTFLFICLSLKKLSLCVRGWTHVMECLWKSEYSLWALVLSFYHAGSGDWTWILGLGDRHIYPLGHHCPDAFASIMLDREPRRLTTLITPLSRPSNTLFFALLKCLEVGFPLATSRLSWLPLSNVHHRKHFKLMSSSLCYTRGWYSLNICLLDGSSVMFFVCPLYVWETEHFQINELNQ